ncbi:hypothetical protein PHYBOEH_001772 [Phytophthora boehmeriae]|uniref:Uncharacterized protein n=1 Tax=Phytophthora boehmeriae TaxID=109152 RepID=A0A8T1X6F8_9STRA|nr:hypothetical protein PHYBOEH_001772 [Phytophthora boehmeriae]
MFGAELQVRSTTLHGFPPFPAWNGTVSAAATDSRSLCSVLSANGELVVLQSELKTGQDPTLKVLKVVPPIADKFSSFCQCWTSDGSVVATAHDRRVALYSTEDFRSLQELQVRNAVTSMDILKLPDTDAFLLLIGSLFGGFLYKIPTDGTIEATLEPVAQVLNDIAICHVKFSPDGRTAALGTVDGRLFLRTVDSSDEDSAAAFGNEELSKVLAAPRVTSMSFSSCCSKLVVATRKGNVYVFEKMSTTGLWRALASCEGLSANPKPTVGGAVGTNKAATAAQTLVSCWGPVFVVCSRALASRLEMYDFESGQLLHSLQLTAAASSSTLNQWVDEKLVTGMCSWRFEDGHSMLLCQDTDANLVVVEWPFLDVIGRPTKRASEIKLHSATN